MIFKSIKDAVGIARMAQDVIDTASAEVEGAKETLRLAERYIRENSVTENDIFPGAVFEFKENGYGIPLVIIALHKNGKEEQTYITTGAADNNPACAWSGPTGTKAQILDYINKGEMFRANKKLAIVEM